VLAVHQPGIVDALFEVGKQRQEILRNLKKAYEKDDVDNMRKYVRELIGLDNDTRASLREKSH
jgi:hypothetical protein